MENKNAVQIFTLLLTLATLYTLSFNWASKRFEAKAALHGAYVADSLNENNLLDTLTLEEATKYYTSKYLRDSIKSVAHGVKFWKFDFTKNYGEVKEKELNLGLDLQGGMSVTLEVSIPDLILSLSDYNEDKTFRNALSAAREAQNDESSDGFMVLFDEAWRAQTSDQEEDDKLWRIFNTLDQKDLFPAQSTDDEILAILVNETEKAIDASENIIRQRIDQLGVAQPNVQKLENGRILVELPGVDDRERARKQLKSTANLEFWETYFNDEVIGKLSEANAAIGKSLHPELFAEDAAPDSTLTEEQLQAQFKLKNPLFASFQMELTRRSAIVGYAQVDDIDDINVLLNRPEAKEAIGANIRLLWEAKPTSNFASLYAIKDESGKGRAVLTGKSIVTASVSYDEIGDVVVSMTMDSNGATIWGDLTEKCASENNRAVAVVLDNLVFSAPNVQSAITSGRSQISFGNDQSGEEKLIEAQDLANLLNAGSLPAPARIVDEVSIGLQLGNYLKQILRSVNLNLTS